MAAKCPGGVILTNTDIPQIYVYLTFLKIWGIPEWQKYSSCAKNEKIKIEKEALSLLPDSPSSVHIEKCFIKWKWLSDQFYFPKVKEVVRCRVRQLCLCDSPTINYLNWSILTPLVGMHLGFTDIWVKSFAWFHLSRSLLTGVSPSNALLQSVFTTEHPVHAPV